MPPMQISTDILQSLDRASFSALNVCRSDGGWQASMQVGINSFRVRHGATPSEAIAELVGGVSVVPPCPVPLATGAPQ